MKSHKTSKCRVCKIRIRIEDNIVAVFVPGMKYQKWVHDLCVSADSETCATPEEIATMAKRGGKRYPGPDPVIPFPSDYRGGPIIDPPKPMPDSPGRGGGPKPEPMTPTLPTDFPKNPEDSRRPVGIDGRVWDIAMEAAKAAIEAADLPARNGDGVTTVTHRIDVVRRDVPGIETIDSAHPALAKILQLAAQRKNILLVGPTGCGKTYVADQTAKILKYRFGFINCTEGMTETYLLGNRLPVDGGAFQYFGRTFLDIFENGGVFLFDELDGADPNVIMVLNSAIGNGFVAVPNRIENPVAHRHPDCIIIAGANTFGTGADRMYVGRNQLDDATLDRFRIGTIHMDYDPGIERALCPDTDLRLHLQEIRARVRKAQLRRSVSMRFLADAYEMTKTHDWTMADVESALFSGWKPEEIKKAKSAA